LDAVDKMDGILGVPVQINGEGVSWGSKMLKIERRGFISCAPLETTADNHGYICWGKIYEVAEELELLD
jgi:hypothetical protein